jgi:hypothetical protein
LRSFLVALARSGVIGPLAKVVGWMGVAAAVMLVIAWVGNPYADKVPEAEQAAPSWRPPAPVESPTDPPLPPGFPSMAFPPPLPQAAEGQPTTVPTRYGLGYSVPAANGWRPSNGRTVSWSEGGRTIVSYGAVSDYGYGYCPETEGSALARVGVQGRNGTDIDTAAREAVDRTGAIFSDAAGARPDVEIRGPVQAEVAGRPAIRYTAVVTGIARGSSCDPSTAQFDVVATSAYASAEVMVLFLQRHTGLPGALSEHDAESILTSLHTTNR